MPNLTVTFWTSKSVFSWLLFFFISLYLYISVLVLLNVDIMPAAGAPNLHLCPALPCTVPEYKFCVLWFTAFPYNNKDQCESSPQFHTTPWPQHCILIVQAGKSRCWKLCWLCGFKVESTASHFTGLFLFFCEYQTQKVCQDREKKRIMKRKSRSQQTVS